MLPSVHVTSVLFLVQFNNFASIGVTYSSRPFLCLHWPLWGWLRLTCWHADLLLTLLYYTPNT